MKTTNPLHPLVHSAVEAVDKISSAFGDAVGKLARQYQPGDPRLTKAIDQLVATYYGSSQRNARSSLMYDAIAEQKVLAGWQAVRAYGFQLRQLVGPDVSAQLADLAERHLDELDRHDHLVADLARLQAPIVAGGAEEDWTLNVVASTYKGKTKRAWQRYRVSAYQKVDYPWVTGSKKPLSGRIWQLGAANQKAISDQIRDSIRAGDSPTSLATKLEQYLKPEFAPVQYLENGQVVRKHMTNKPGGWGSTHARTLARTELTKSNGEWTVNLVKDTIGAIGTKWNLSASHPGIDPCDQKAKYIGKAGIPGVFTKDNPPRYPAHPNCLCYLTPYMKDRKGVLDDLKKQYPTLKVPAQPTGTKALGATKEEQLAAIKAKKAAFQAKLAAQDVTVSKPKPFDWAKAQAKNYKTKAKALTKTYNVTNMPEGSKIAAQRYSNNSYGINKWLRDGPDAVPQSHWENLGFKDAADYNITKVIADLDKAAELTTALDDMVVYRGVIAPQKYADLKIGDTFVDKGFASTTLNPELQGYDAHLRFEIAVPKDSHGIWIDGFKKNSQDEWLIPRNTTYRVLSEDFQGEKRILRLEIVEAQPTGITEIADLAKPVALQPPIEPIPPTAPPMTSAEFQTSMRSYSRGFSTRLKAAENGAEMRGALASYKDGAYSEMNNLLRRGKLRYQSEYNPADRYHKLNQLVEQSFQYAKPIGRSTEVYRGTRSGRVFQEMAGLAPGDVVSDAGFVSTSTSKSTAFSSFGGQSGAGYTTRMHITLPPETRGVWLDAIAAPREQEFLLNRNATFVVKKVVTEGRKRDVWLEYIAK